MTALDLLAEQLGVSGRTLRRAAARGTIRGAQTTARGVEVPPREQEYVRRSWPLIECALSVLRTRPNVRLAVLFGSAAGGSPSDTSDVDLLVRVRGDWTKRTETAAALEQALGRPVQLVTLDGAPPLLLVDVLRDGRVLVDRDGEWERLKRRARSIERAAAGAAARLDEAAWQTLDRFGEVVET